MKEKMLLVSYLDNLSREIEVEYREVEHWNTTDTGMKAYEVYEGETLIGKIERAVENTDRLYGRIRLPGKGRLAWSWRGVDGRRNSPGLYPSSRRSAVADMLGYSEGRKI